MSSNLKTYMKSFLCWSKIYSIGTTVIDNHVQAVRYVYIKIFGNFTDYCAAKSGAKFNCVIYKCVKQKM